MEEQELERQIRDYIKTIYNAEYEGLLKVKKENNFYIFTIGIPSYMTPTTITYEVASDDIFLRLIKEELKKINYMRIYFYKVVKNEEY